MGPSTEKRERGWKTSRLDTRSGARHLERMPAQHGQTYDPQAEPAPRGCWFWLEKRPYPERLDRAFRMLAVAIGVAAAILDKTNDATYRSA